MPAISAPQYVVKTASYTIGYNDDVVQFNCATGSFTATLLSAVSVIVGRHYTIRRAADATSANTLTINTTSAQTIDGRASGSIRLQPSDYVVVVSDGANWQVVTMQETIAAKYFASTSQTLGSSTGPNFDTKVYDTHSAATPAVGNWIYTSTIPGKYRFTFYFNNSGALASGVGINVTKNTVIEEQAGGAVTAYPAVVISFTINLAAADAVSLRPTGSFPFFGAATLAGGASWITIEKVGN